MAKNILAEEPDYRWNEDYTESLAPTALYAYLYSEAQEMVGQDEWDVAYGIWRELVCRFPERAEAWRGLESAARALGYLDESSMAQACAEGLEAHGA